MRAQDPRARRGRPRRIPPQTLPDDMFKYADDRSRTVRPHRNPSPDAFDFEKQPVSDDWPEKVPVTEVEVDIFERYFGDVLDRLFDPLDAEGNEGLNILTSDVNNKL